MARPRLDAQDPSVAVSLRMPSKQLDDLCKRALRAGVSVPEIIRRDLKSIENPQVQGHGRRL